MGLNDSLRELFLVDQQLRGLEGRLDGARSHVRTQQVKIDQLTAQLHALAEQLRRVQASEAGLESDATGYEQRINKLREQMNSAKTNKEFSAMLVEVNTLKTDKAKIEDQAIELMGQIEQARTEHAAIEQRIAEQRKILHLAESELTERMNEVGDRLEQLKEKRRVAAGQVPPEALAVFDKLADALDGEALAPVEQEDPRRMEYTCGGCYMGIPIETVNRLWATDKIVRCTSCTRILYLSEQMRETLASK